MLPKSNRSKNWYRNIFNASLWTRLLSSMWNNIFCEISLQNWQCCFLATPDRKKSVLKIQCKCHFIICAMHFLINKGKFLSKKWNCNLRFKCCHLATPSRRANYRYSFASCRNQWFRVKSTEDLISIACYVKIVHHINRKPYCKNKINTQTIQVVPSM